MDRAELVGQNSETVSGFLSYISHDFASKAIAPTQQPTGEPGRPYKTSTTMAPLDLRARPCRTKKPGIQLMRLNAGRGWWIFGKFWLKRNLEMGMAPACLPLCKNAFSSPFQEMSSFAEFARRVLY